MKSKFRILLIGTIIIGSVILQDALTKIKRITVQEKMQNVLQERISKRKKIMK
jgi:hypothetical protein